MDGKFKGFVGTVVSSPQHNITGHLVLRRKAKSGALHQQEIFLGQEKEDLKAQIREVLDLERLGGKSMTTDELVKSPARKGALVSWGHDGCEEAQLKRQGVGQIAIELIEEHYSQANPVQLEGHYWQQRPRRQTLRAWKDLSSKEKKLRRCGNFPAFYGSELLSVHENYARCFVSLEELSLQPPAEISTCPASVNYLVSVALKDGDALADISLGCNCRHDDWAVGKQFDTVVSLLYCLLLLGIYIGASL